MMNFPNFLFLVKVVLFQFAARKSFELIFFHEFHNFLTFLAKFKCIVIAGHYYIKIQDFFIVLSTITVIEDFLFPFFIH